MSGLPDTAKLSCTQCGVDVAWVTTQRKSKGQPVELLIDFHPDQGTGGTVPVQALGQKLYGDAVSKSMADAMRARGRSLHAQHKDTCVKRNATRKRS